MPRCVSVPKELISVSSQLQAYQKPNIQATAFNVWKYTQTCGTTVVSPDDIQAGGPGGVLMVTVESCLQTSVYASSMEVTVSCVKNKGDLKDGVSHPTFSEAHLQTLDV